MSSFQRDFDEARRISAMRSPEMDAVKQAAYELDIDDFYARGDLRRLERMSADERRMRRRIWGTLLTIAGAALAYYVVQTIVWGVM